MKFLPHRLVSARKMRGLSLESLRELLPSDITRQSLHKYETGQMNPDSKMIHEICSALDIRSDYFYRESNVSLGEFSFRKLEKCPVKDQEKIKEVTYDYLERYLEIEDILGLPVKPFKHKHSIQIEDKADIDKGVAKLRKDLGLGLDAMYNIFELLEDKGVKVLEVEAGKDIDGVSTWVNKNTAVIIINKNRGSKDRKRFTALHELGHLVLDIHSFTEKQQEKFCNYFASAMLMPKETFFKEIGEKRSSLNFRELGLIKKQYGISIQAQLYRAKDLGIINASSFKTAFIMINKMGWKVKEPQEFDFEGNEKSNRMLQLILRAISEELITSSKAAALLNMKLTEFRNLISNKNFD